MERSTALRENGVAIVRAAVAFAVEDTSRTWREVLPTLLLVVVLQAALLSALPLALKIPLAILFALVLVRAFIFFHDVHHGAIFRRSTLGRLLVNAVSIYFIYSPSVWRSRHDTHHGSNSIANDQDVAGQIPMLTLTCWRTLDGRSKRAYKMFRNPIALALGVVPYFMLSSWQSFREDPRRHWTAPLWIGIAPAIAVAFAWRAGVPTMLVAFGFPMLLSAAIGSYLFYAQHSVESVRYQEPDDWNYFFAALHTSTMFDMPRWMHWFTGNIGYHHVHHIHAAIPFYRLPEAMAAIPALQNPPRTSWRFRDVHYALTHHVWDDVSQRMLTYEEADLAVGTQWSGMA